MPHIHLMIWVATFFYIYIYLYIHTFTYIYTHIMSEQDSCRKQSHFVPKMAIQL